MKKTITIYFKQSLKLLGIICIFLGMSVFVNAQQKTIKATFEYEPGYIGNLPNIQVPSVFIDAVCSGLKQGTTIEDINTITNPFYKKMALAMYNNEYPSEFRIQSYEPYIHPNVLGKTNKTNQYNLLDNATGIYAEQGDTILIFVGNKHGENISLRQINFDGEADEKDGYSDKVDYALTTGVSKFVATKKGLLYVIYHLDEKREKMPDPVQIHFATGKVNGYFDITRHNNQDWIKLLANSKAKFIDVKGIHSHLTFPVQSFKTYCPKNAEELITVYDSIVSLEKELLGFYKYPERNPKNRMYFSVMYTSYMYAAGDHTGYHVSTMPDLCDYKKLRTSTVWGPAHEVGHMNQTRPGLKWGGMTEVTNNIFSLYVQTKYGNASRIYTQKPSTGRNNDYENAYNMLMLPKKSHFQAGGVFNQLVPFWQLYLYSTYVKNYPDFYKDLHEEIRKRSDRNASTQSGLISLDFTNLCSELLQEDLTDFFDAWGFYRAISTTINDYAPYTVNVEEGWCNTAKNKNSKFGTKPVYKIEYMDDANYNIFAQKKAVVKGTCTRSGDYYSMKGWGNVVAYEVYNEKDSLVYIASMPQFTTIGVSVVNPKIYAIAWDGTKTAADVVVSDLLGALNVSDETTTYWYCIQNTINFEATGSGEGPRVGLYISSKGESEQTNIWNLYASGNKDYQLWKVVNAPVKGQYYIVNKANGYKLGYGTSPLDVTRYYTNPTTNTPFTISLCSGSDYCVMLKANAGTALLGGWGSNALYDGTVNYNTPPTASENPSLPVKGPRGWIFVSEEKINNCYPQLSSEESGEYWYFIESVTQEKVLFDNISANHVLGIESKAQNEDNDSQLWKFVKLINPTNYSDAVYIVNKATGKYISSIGTSTTDAVTGYVLQHLLRDDDNQFRLCSATNATALRVNPTDNSISQSDILPCGWGSNNAFRFKLKGGQQNSIKNSQQDPISVSVENGYIKVSGADKSYKVYTVFGKEINPREKQPTGIYIVKIGDAIRKIFVK